VADKVVVEIVVVKAVETVVVKAVVAHADNNCISYISLSINQFSIILNLYAA